MLKGRLGGLKEYLEHEDLRFGSNRNRNLGGGTAGSWEALMSEGKGRWLRGEMRALKANVFLITG